MQLMLLPSILHSMKVDHNSNKVKQTEPQMIAVDFVQAPQQRTVGRQLLAHDVVTGSKMLMAWPQCTRLSVVAHHEACKLVLVVLIAEHRRVPLVSPESGRHTTLHTSRVINRVHQSGGVLR